MSVARPTYQNYFSAGNLITLLFGALTAAAIITRSENRSESNHQLLNDLKQQIEENEDEINNLKINEVRLFEKLDNIYVTVRKIESHLDQVSR